MRSPTIRLNNAVVGIITRWAKYMICGSRRGVEDGASEQVSEIVCMYHGHVYGVMHLWRVCGPCIGRG